MSKPRIRYLTTDLDLHSGGDPTTLVTELEVRGICGYLTACDDGTFSVVCNDVSNDVCDLSIDDGAPEKNIMHILNAIESLSSSAMSIWESCRKREFDIAYECGDKPWAFNQGLSNDVLQRIADCGAALRITIYPHRPDVEEVVDFEDDG